MTDRSRAALQEFLDYLANKGLMAKATVAARKAACSKVLGILDDDEASDVTVVDLDRIISRFGILHGKNYTPQSLTTYKSRARSALDDFSTYLANPLAFRPALQSRERVKERQSKPVQQLSAAAGEPIRTDAVPAKPTHVAMATSNILPIPLRADLTVFIQGLPFDLSASEAKKIANVVTAMSLSND